MELKQIFNVNTKSNSQFIKEDKQLFEVLYPEKNDIVDIIDEREFINKKRFHNRLRRFENRDNIRRKIKRGFFNALIENMNKNLKNNGSHLFFEKFPQKFLANISRNTNKEILNMTLEEIMEKKELYASYDLAKYNHNLIVVKSKDFQELKEIWNKKYCELFEEYINSKEFMVDEINRLKNKNYGDNYIKKYICLSRHFLEFFIE